MSSSLFLYALLPVLILLGWSYTAMILGRSLPVFKNKAIVLLVAHPDDEAMFFAPTVLALTRPELGNHLKILCLSNGNADGLGAIRRHEIVASGKRLGLRSEQDVMVLDDPAFQDGFDAEWPADKISALLSSLFVKNTTASGRNPSSSSSSSSSKRKQATASATSSSSSSSAAVAGAGGVGAGAGEKVETTIDALITFDAGGVSGHPNHVALHHGAAAWARSLARAGRDDPVRVYALTSVNMARKYAGVLDAPFTLAWNAGGGLTMTRPKGESSSSSSSSSSASSRQWPRRVMFVNDVGQWIAALGAMVYAHRSQMVWFRWGWITLGRYMVVNDLRRVAV